MNQCLKLAIYLCENMKSQIHIYFSIIMYRLINAKTTSHIATELRICLVFGNQPVSLEVCVGDATRETHPWGENEHFAKDDEWCQ